MDGGHKEVKLFLLSTIRSKLCTGDHLAVEKGMRSKSLDRDRVRSPSWNRS